MGEAGWLSGWLPRMLQPLAPASLRKRRTPCPQDADGSYNSHPSVEGNPSKRQRVEPTSTASDNLTVRTTNQMIHCISQHHQHPYHQHPLSDQHPPLPPKREQAEGLKTLQPRCSSIAGATKTAARAQNVSRGCGGESDASFASVPSDDEVTNAQPPTQHCKIRRGSGARKVLQPQLAPSWPALHDQHQSGRRQQQHRGPPLPLQQLHQKQQKGAFPSLLQPTVSLLLGGPAGSHHEGNPGKGPAAATTAIAAPGSGADAGSTAGSRTAEPATLSYCPGAVPPRLLRCFSGRNPRATGPGCVRSATSSASSSVAASASLSTSELPVLPPLYASSPVRSRSTSALPLLSSVARRGPGVPATTLIHIEKTRNPKQQQPQQLLHQKQHKQREQQVEQHGQQEQRGMIREGGPLVHPGGLQGTEEITSSNNSSTSSSSNTNLGQLRGTKDRLGPPLLQPRQGPMPPPQRPYRGKPSGEGVPQTSAVLRRVVDREAHAEHGATLESAQGLFISPKMREEEAPVDGEILFGHRVLRPLVSKDPMENYDAFLDILKHAKKYCEAETLDLLTNDKELLYYTRGSHHPKIALRSNQQQLQQLPSHRGQQLLAGARPAWALPAALLTALNSQREVDPFSIFGDAPPELLLHEVYGQQHYNAVGPRIRATHPVLARLEKHRLLPQAANSSNTSMHLQQQPHGVATTATTVGDGRQKGYLTAESWRDVLLPALLSWWRLDSSVELDWRQDPLTAEDFSWYLEAIGATRDLTDIVTLKQPCFCPTPPPQRGWSWTDSRQLLRRRLAAGAISAVRERLSTWLSPSPPKRYAGEKATRARNPVPLTPKRAAPPLRVAATAAVLSPITPGVRRRRQRKWAEASAAFAGRGDARKRSRRLSRNGSPTVLPAAPREVSAAVPAADAVPAAAVVPGAVGAIPSSLKREGGLSGELGRLLADAQRRLDSLAERMRSRSRPPLNAGANAAGTNRPRSLSSTKCRSSERGEGGARSFHAISASEDPLGVGKHQEHSGSSTQRILAGGGNLLQMGPSQQTGVAIGRCLPQAGGCNLTGGSYHSSSNLPLLGRELGTFVLPPSTGGAIAGTRDAEGPKRAHAGAGKTREARGVANRSEIPRKRPGRARLSVDRLYPAVLSSHAAIWALR